MRVHAESTVSTAMLLLLLLLIVVSSHGNVAQGGISLLQLQPFGAAAAAAVAACFGGRIRVVPVHPSMSIEGINGRCVSRCVKMLSES